MNKSIIKDQDDCPVVVIVDDDEGVRLAVETLLVENGFKAISLSGSSDFYALGDHPPIDMVLIDLRLDGESGLTLAKHIRRSMDLPIVMFTGVGDELDKIEGLDAGADDYIMKPFNPRELIARIHAVLRRYMKPQIQSKVQETDGLNEISFGDKMLDCDNRQLLNSFGEEIPLTNGEYRLLEVFLRNPDTIIPREDLLAELGSDLTQYVDRTIDVLILRLRRKIEHVPSKPIHLQTRRGLGYIFVRSPSGHEG